MDRILNKKELKEKFPKIIEVINKLSNDYAIEKKFAISLYAFDKEEDIEKIVSYIYPTSIISVSWEVDMIDKNEALVLVGRNKNSKTPRKTIISNFIFEIILKSNEFKTKFPQFYKIFEKTSNDYTPRQRFAISLCKLKEEDIKNVLTYISPIYVIKELTKVPVNVEKFKKIKNILKNIIESKKEEQSKKLDSILRQANTEEEINKAAEKIVETQTTHDNAAHQVEQSDNGTVGAGENGEQIYEEVQNSLPEPIKQRKTNFTFDEIFIDKNTHTFKTIDEIKTILNNPSKKFKWVNINTIDKNGNTLLTWSLLQDNIMLKKFASQLIRNEISNSININHENDNGKTAMDIAITGGYFANRETRLSVPIIQYLIENGAYVRDEYKEELKNNGIYIQSSANNCTDYILEKNILNSTSSYAGFELCQLKTIHKTFLDICVAYYDNDENIKRIIHKQYGTSTSSLLDMIDKRTEELELESNSENVSEEKLNRIVECRHELNSLLNTYELLQQLLLKKRTSKNVVSYLFTSWIKLIFPISSSDKPIHKTYKLISDLLTELHQTLIDINILNKLGMNVKDINKITNEDPLKFLIFNMIFYLVPPDEALRFRVHMLKSYNIMSFYNRNIRIENQNIIMALIHDFNIASVEKFFENVYRIPIDIPTGKTKIFIDDKFTDDDSWKNMETGIETIIAIMKSSSKNLKAKETLDVITKTAPIRKKLAETDETRAFFIYAPTEDMFSNNLNSLQFYTLYDILCNQFFQEYKEVIDKEHLITSAKLRYMCNYAATTEDDQEFDLIMSIIEFALVSYFVQNQLTGECNRAAGTKPRWSQTIEQYRRILTFICQLYLLKKNKIDANMSMNGTSYNTNDYITRMFTESKKINSGANIDRNSKLNFVNQPTILFPNVVEEEYKINNISPLIHYGFDVSVLQIEQIGARMNKLRKKQTAEYIIDRIFERKEQILAYTKIKKIIENRIDNMYEYTDIIDNKLDIPTRSRNRFGSESSEKLSEEASLLLQLPPLYVIDERINKMNNLIDKIERENPKVDIFEKVISFHKNVNIGNNRTQEQLASTQQLHKEKQNYRDTNKPTIINYLRNFVNKSA